MDSEGAEVNLSANTREELNIERQQLTADYNKASLKASRLKEDLNEINLELDDLITQRRAISDVLSLSDAPEEQN